ncbi:bifunctional phosphoglucose/phosphomannose isomerase [Candidatus Poribacteria bacterium]|nr:MAG: bifunctional phosphoglucose/phosphomannose isomerase [Candidatus Poribacteria bacterium]
MTTLNPAQIKQHDSEDMLELLSSFSGQCKHGWEIGEALKLEGYDNQIPNNLVIAGMGGSGIGGDLVKAVVGGQVPCPIIVHRGYTLPAFVTSQTLFIAVSYSGNTEETLLSVEQAFAQGANILVVTSGGKLKAFADTHSLPCVMIPPGQPPRASLGYLLMPILSVFAGLGFDPHLDLRSDLEEAVALLAKLEEDFQRDVPENQPKQLAQALYGKLPIIYAPQELEAIAMRWKGQMNENGKSLAYYSVYPEMNHNEIEGWKHPSTLTQQCHVIQLRDLIAPSQTQRRMDITAKLIQPHTGGITQVDSVGSSLLARLLSLVAIGDWASFYLAILYEQNPTPVRRIEELKRRLEA